MSLSLCLDLAFVQKQMAVSPKLYQNIRVDLCCRFGHLNMSCLKTVG